jgi:catalase
LEIEQRHIASAVVFELSQMERVDIRERMVANLRNVDEELAATIAGNLGIATLPPRARPAREPLTDLPLRPSDALSILANGPDSFAGRKIGILTADGADHALLRALPRAGVQEHDDGCCALDRTRDAATFVATCRALRLWTRVGAAH